MVYFLFIETGNLSLEETAAVLDGVEVQTQLTDSASKKLDTLTEKGDASVQQTEV